MVNENIKTKQDHHPKITGGLILILLGTLFLLTEMDRISWADWWAYFLVGLGGIFLLEALLRSFSAEARRGISGRVTAGLILAIIGGSYLIGFMEWWPLILIALGVVVLVSAFLKK
ncbi:MAG: hypothetical protein WBC70_13490 [Candidatus Aminicenantales bacterium]